MNWFPTAEEYERLYKRFLVRSPMELLCKVPLKPGDIVLDLCCGPMMRLAKAAAAGGAARVDAVDLSPHAFCDQVNIKGNGNCSIFDFILDSPRDVYDIVACQQGINYWFDTPESHMLSKVIVKGGAFVFNTFNRLPPSEIHTRTYELNGLHYTEVTDVVTGNDSRPEIHHVQFVDGLPPHWNKFKFIKPEEFREWLALYFDKVEENILGNTTIWVARK
jgi:hypothetical protein